jgi:acetoin utilization protein AcuB
MRARYGRAVIVLSSPRTKSHLPRRPPLTSPPRRPYVRQRPQHTVPLSPIVPMLVRSRMTADVIVAAPDTTIAGALNLCRRHRIRHLPVLDGDRVAGLVTDRELRLAMPPIWADQHDELRALLHEKHVGEVMIREIVTVAPDTSVEDAAKLLYTHRLCCLPVLEDGRLVGILTETDVLRAFVELFGTQDATTRMEVHMPNRPGELARVVRQIGIERRVNIAAMVVTQLPGGESAAIMRLHTQDPEPIAESLRKLGYRVGVPALDLDADALLEAPPLPRDRVAVEL